MDYLIGPKNINEQKTQKKSHYIGSLKRLFHSNYFIIVLFLIIGLSIYANSFHNQMFWDDEDFILNNEYIKDWKYLPKYFSENVIAGAGLMSDYWRPILLMAFSIQWSLWQDWTVGWHFINTLFHTVDAILLFFILLYVFRNRILSFSTSLVFLVHPLQTEAVVYVNSLGDSLSIFFVFLGILLYLKFRMSEKAMLKSAPYFFSILMYALAVMSKETAIIMPALLFIVDFFFLGREGKLSLEERLKKVIKGVWPFFVLGVAYFILRLTVLNFVDVLNPYEEKNIFTSSFYVRLLTFFRVLTTYFGLLFWPFDLHMERSVEIATSLGSFSVIFGAFLFFGLLALAFTKFNQYPILSFGILWFFIGLAPTSNLAIPTVSTIYEHWLYLPLIGIFLSVIWLGMFIGKKYNIQKILALIFVFFLIFLSALTIDRNEDWKDPITFYTDTLEYTPNSYRVTNNLGMAYADVGDYESAEETYKKAIDLDPGNPVAYHNLGNSYKEIGKVNLAVENYRKAIDLDPGFIFSYNALLNIYVENNNLEKAREILEKYLDHTDSRIEKIEILVILSQIAVEEENFRKAKYYLNKSLEIDPENHLTREQINYVESLK